jgi:hypothetical protein
MRFNVNSLIQCIMYIIHELINVARLELIAIVLFISVFVIFGFSH